MKEEKGITLVALVITIIILLILVGITISQLTNSGLFDKTKLAKEEWKNAQESEEISLKEYENNVSNYMYNTREGNNKIDAKSLINTNDSIYNKDRAGYIFDVSNNYSSITTNNIINLNETIKNYNYIIFEFDICRGNGLKPYAIPTSQMISVEQIEYQLNNPDLYDRYFANRLVVDTGDTHTILTFNFRDEKTIEVTQSWSNEPQKSNIGIRITNIKGM